MSFKENAQDHFLCFGVMCFIQQVQDLFALSRLQKSLYGFQE